MHASCAFSLFALFLAACSAQTAEPPAGREGVAEGIPAQQRNGDQQRGGQQDELKAAMDRMMEQMRSHPMSGDQDVDHAQLTIIHHQGAIEMSEILQRSGSNARMKDFARKQIAEQGKSIDELKQFVKEHPAPKEARQGSMDPMSMPDVDLSGNMDEDYARLMIAHHREGIRMAEKERDKGHHAELKQMATRSIAKERADISELEAWLRER